MSRVDRLVRLVVAGCGVVAVALAAATIEPSVEPGSDGGGGGTGGGGPGGLEPRQPADEPTGGVEIPAFLEYLGYAVAILFAIALVWYLIAHRRELVRLVAGCLLIAFVVAVVLTVLLPLLESPPQQVENLGLADDGETGSDGGDAVSLPVPPVVVALAIVASVFVLALLVTRREDPDSDGSEPASTADAADSTGASAAIGTAAGRAADRLDDGTAVENEIYRAWWRMTDLLEVDRPDSSTPREFAAAAVDAGIDRDDVEALTRLFEDVRYGEVEPTPAMEARATRVFRRIETTYADAGDDDRTGATGGYRTDPGGNSHPTDSGGGADG